MTDSRAEITTSTTPQAEIKTNTNTAASSTQNQTTSPEKDTDQTSVEIMKINRKASEDMRRVYAGMEYDRLPILLGDLLSYTKLISIKTPEFDSLLKCKDSKELLDAIKNLNARTDIRENSRLKNTFSTLALLIEQKYQDAEKFIESTFSDKPSLFEVAAELVFKHHINAHKELVIKQTREKEEQAREKERNTLIQYLKDQIIKDKKEMVLLENKITQLTEKLSTSESTLKTKEEENMGLVAKQKAIEIEFKETKLKAQKKEEDRLHALDDEIKRLTNHNALLLTQYDAIAEQSQKLLKQIQELSKKNKELAKQNEALTGKNEVLTRQNEVLTGKNEALTTQNKALAFKTPAAQSLQITSSSSASPPALFSASPSPAVSPHIRARSKSTKTIHPSP